MSSSAAVAVSDLTVARGWFALDVLVTISTTLALALGAATLRRRTA